MKLQLLTQLSSKALRAATVRGTGAGDPPLAYKLLLLSIFSISSAIFGHYLAVNGANIENKHIFYLTSLSLGYKEAFIIIPHFKKSYMYVYVCIKYKYSNIYIYVHTV